MLERTLAIVKPDAVMARNAGKIIDIIETQGLRIVGMKMATLTAEAAAGFYRVHRGRDFYDPLIVFMTSGPIIVMVLEGENAISRWREIMGATDVKKAAEGTVRRRFGTSVRYNATHGSDAPETAAQEIGYFFSRSELAV
jgi:nucleoside-diphosphate kinase